MAERPDDIIPQNESGIQTDTEASRECATVEEAKQFYELVKERLLHVHRWHDLAGALTAEFQLTDSQGREEKRATREGDYWKIDIPGPGSLTGEGFDWVRVERMEEHEDPYTQRLLIRVRPAPNPQNEDADVAHFLSDEATSSFVVKREATKVTATVHGRNEKPNVDTEAVVDKARNAAVATGAMTAFSKLQWKSLVNGLIEKEKGT
ncbi:hypothetical protein V9K67_16140 [Paraflavisolibacter sp. H34]|uniref:hypothetical protein n=1 Tax=Huijunlia imazamoxiresistens TaxID=3127457 RepID=UPI0030169E02